MNIKSRQSFTSTQKGFIGIGLVLVFIGVMFNCFGKATQGATTYGIAIVFLYLAFIDKIKSIKGFGIELVSKTKEERKKEIVADLKKEKSENKNTIIKSDDLNIYLSAEDKAVSYIKKKYPQGILIKQNKILLRNRTISTDGFIQLDSKDIFIEIKISKLSQPPLSFLLQSLKQYLSKIKEYSDFTKQTTLLEFVVVGEFDQLAKDKALIYLQQKLSEYVVPVNITFLSFSQLEIPITVKENGFKLNQ